MTRATLFLAFALAAGICQSATARIEGEAVPGRPFGVARITLAAADVGGPIDPDRVLITERDDRALYPAVMPSGVNRVFARLLGQPQVQGASNVTITFLFHGEQPLKLTLYTPAATEITLTPQAPVGPPAAQARGQNRLLQQWWRDYNAVARKQQASSDHPPLVHNYLLSMLQARLGLEAPLLDRVSEKKPSQSQRSVELLLGMERLRSETLKNSLLGRGDFGQPLSEPVPAPIAWPALPLPQIPADVAVEPIALHVPHECFYIRFGKFPNYLWMNRLLEDYGGDISGMVTLRSYWAPLNKRVQGQLSLEQNVLADLLGDKVISDVALIGRDTYMNEGAAIGILFEAKDNRILTDDINQQRSRGLEREKPNGATAETLQIAGREVSLVSTPDNRLRSFYATDGNYHLVTTSRAIVERFLAVSNGAGSLGASDEFRFARLRMPLERDDTIFVYMSAAFFQGLLSPQYQIELQRRIQSVTDMELLALARLAAKGEDVPNETIEELIAAGMLPPGFGKRPDGSGPIVTAGAMLDSRRGARGTFLPIPDVKIEGLARDEAARYAAQATLHAEAWQQLDPLLVGIKRFALNDSGLERITLDGEIAPLSESKYGWLMSILGPPTRTMITPAAGDVVNLQASIRGGVLSPNLPPHQMFLGVQDMIPLGDAAPKGVLQTLQFLQSSPAYLGTWPRAGFLDMLPLGLGGGQPDAYGFSKLLFGLWRRQGAGFSVLSFDYDLLANITPHLRVVEAEQEAQIRLHMHDLSQVKFSDWLNATYYQRAWQASAGNTRLMHTLNQQLQVPMADAQAVAERLLDAKLRCPLGGEYELVEQPGSTPIWQSTAWPEQADGSVPADFRAPLLTWFRGVDAHLTKIDDKMAAHVELDMQRKPAEKPKFELPLFNLFGGGQKALKPDPKAKPAEELPPPLPPVPRVPGREF